MPIYIKIEGIDGDVTQAKYKGWIDAESLQWGVGRAVMTPVGSTMNREASAPTLSELTFTKTMDRSTALILQETCSGESGKKVTVEMMTTANPPKTYMKYELEDALLSGYSCSGASGGGRPSESISLNFTKITTTYTVSDEKGNDLTSLTAHFDVTEGKAG
ncbi:MAG: type VI secretion system tube protein Hcp [Rhodospirillaceae bacterium]|nr:type VI secretion system tube protein Hcp [Rhodospirillaceae bacterium]